MAVAGQDGFNWGYDPLHFTTPEGSYATDPEGGARTLEFRRMVAALNRAGLRVVIDVVYNHTTDAGQGGRNNLDRIVPGLLPPAQPSARIGRDLDVLLQHRDRARDDGKADDRLGAHLGQGLQGRRVPVRPHGAPAQGRPWSSCASGWTG